jgi:fructokinase
MTAAQMIAGIELGGTKSIAVLAFGRDIVANATVPTTTPQETLGALRRTIDAWKNADDFAAIGIASFGPLRLDRQACDYGRMLPTPKPGWTGADIVSVLSGGLNRPCLIDTDVNAAALAEWRWGAGRGHDSLCYVTLGTGVGGGLLIDGRSVHGALHPEIGHLRLRRAAGDGFPGVCPFHGDCAEGLIAGPAIEARFGMQGCEIADDDPRWAYVVHDLAQLIGALLAVTSPRRILVGGGIGLGRSFLLDRVREKVAFDLAGYLPHVSDATMADMIASPALGANAGPLGAVALGEAALRGSRAAGKGEARR